MGKSLTELSRETTLSDSDLILIDSDGVSKSMTVSTLKSQLKPSTAGTADKAVADSNEQNIASTYIKQLSLNDHTLTVLNGASSATQTINLPDTTYNTGSTATAGLTKLYTTTGENTDGTMTQAAITSALAAIDGFNIVVADALPTSNIQTHTLYLIPGTGATQNARDEYIYVNNAWEKIGTTVADIGGIPYVSGLTQSGSTVSVARNSVADQTINVGVTEITLGAGFTASTITDTGSIALPTVTSASTAGANASSTGTDGTTVEIPRVIVDEYGRVTSLTGYTLTNKDTTYSNGTGLDLNAGAFSLSTCVAGGSFGPSANVTGSNGSTMSIPSFTVDNYGRITSVENKTYTAQDSTYTPASLGFGYATCATLAATAAKTATLTGYELVAGGIVVVKFTEAVPANATLSINSQTATAIYYNGAAITGGVINAGDTATLIYNGTYYHVLAVDSSVTVIDGGSED